MSSVRLTTHPAANLRFGATATGEGMVSRALYEGADWLFTAPHRTQRFVKAAAYQNGKNSSLLGKFLLNPMLKTGNWFMQNFGDFDYKKFITVAGTKLAQPSPGAFAVMLFPFTIFPRLTQALKRAVGGDTSEFTDILWRDIPTIAFLLYLHDPTVNTLMKWRQSQTGVKLTQKGHAIGFDELANKYVVKGENTLAEILRIGNKGNALETALTNYTQRWRLALAEGSASHSDLGTLERQIKELVTAHSREQELKDALKQFKGPDAKGSEAGRVAKAAYEKQKDAVNAISKAAHKIIERLEASKTGNSLVGDLADKGKAKVAELLPDLREFFVRYAKTRRLPVDVVSFAFVAFAIGWLPVWFNEYRTKRKFESQPAANGPAAQALSPEQVALTLQLLRSRSAAAQQFNARYAGQLNAFGA